MKLSREWDLLQNHPEVNGPNIRNGRALNFLLNRLDVNLLGYGYALDNNQEAKAFLDRTAVDARNGARSQPATDHLR